MPTDPEWYRTFFQGIVVETWRRAIPASHTLAEADFLEQVLALAPGARVLDVPCGAGRHALALAARGYQMTGVDLSADMLDGARQEASPTGLTVEWHLADMRDLAWAGVFDAGYCFGNSFGYLDAEGSAAFLRAVSRALRPGARFALDTGSAAESVLPNLRDRDETQVGDILFIEENRYDPMRSLVETTYSFVRGGRTVTRAALHWVYTVREIQALFTSAGLRPLDLYGATDRTPFKAGSHCLTIVAEKS
jgi:SAM-dependent methyltransferase